ncbi:MAG: hypothetical protein QGG05_02275 [Candidatus Latescibacteria bacterium]|nr:hypothetical protein [Candidatus Latescibacterota bacterium]
MNRDETFPAIIFTDDGWIMASPPPLTAQDLREKIVASYADTAGALGWSIGDHEVYHCELESGEHFGEYVAGLDGSTNSFVHSATPGAEERIAHNLQTLIAADEGPLTVLAADCRRRGIPFFPRVRMNSHYVIDPAHPGYGRFRRGRPNLLIGRPGERLPEGSLEWAIRTGKDYAFAEVRQYMETVICETFECFEVDGVELDFMRHPGWFRIEEAQANAYLMTDLVRRVRSRLRARESARGRRQWLIVRVPPTLADSRRTGLDVTAWIDEDLVDIVVVGGGFIPFETPVAEFVEAARGSDCRIYGCIEATRYIDDRHLRALASRWYEDGADGVYLYNFFTMSRDWNGRIFAELAEPERMARHDKIYGTDSAGPVSPVEGHSGGFRYASPSTQLPVTLQPDFQGVGPYIVVRVTDDLVQALNEKAIDSCNLAIRLSSQDSSTVADHHRLEVALNGELLPWEQARVQVGGWSRLQISPLFWADYPTYPQSVEQETTLVEFDVSAPPLRHGVNKVEIGLASTESEPLVVEGVEICITYKEQG